MLGGDERPGATRARAELVACETCGGAQREADGRTRGEHLLERVRGELSTRAASGVDDRVDCSSVRCLWACKRSCAVLLRSPGRVGYMLVDLPPDETSARALVDYAGLYLQTPDGSVPYKSWPAALKGHFLCRIPSLPEPRPAAVTEPAAAPCLTPEVDPS